MNRIFAVYCWDLMQGLSNRFLQFFALACLIGGTAIFTALPEPQTLPLIFIQALLFFGSLFAFLIGWSSGQQTRAQGAFFFAQPLSGSEIFLGKFLGTATWCILFLALFVGPSALRAGNPEMILVLGPLALGFMLVCLSAGLLIGLTTAPVSGLMAVLVLWIISVAGWELALLVLSRSEWIQRSPSLFVSLLLLNPAGVFRVAAMIGLESVPFDAAELKTGRRVFQNIMLTATGIYILWLSVLHLVGVAALRRKQY